MIGGGGGGGVGGGREGWREGGRDGGREGGKEAQRRDGGTDRQIGKHMLKMGGNRLLVRHVYVELQTLHRQTCNHTPPGSALMMPLM